MFVYLLAELQKDIDSHTSFIKCVDIWINFREHGKTQKKDER